MSAASSPRASRGTGLAFGIAAYGLWGFLPGYFLILEPASPWEIVAFRVLMSLVFCALLLTVTRSRRGLVGRARQPPVTATAHMPASEGQKKSTPRHYT